MLDVKGYRILVKADDIEKVTDFGIVLILDEKLERSGQQFGTVVGVGESCWAGRDNGGKLVEGKAWCKVGDRVLFSKHSGRFVYDPETEEELLIMNDDDILAVVVETEK
jgi:co-chaperonin GroES (HSP10)